MQAVTTIGLDIAKSVFQVHGIDSTGQVVIRRRKTTLVRPPQFAQRRTTMKSPAPFSDSSSAAALAPAAPHERLLYAGPVEDCRRRCAGDFAGCNTNHPDQTAQCKHDYSQCLAKCTSHNG